MTRCAPPDFLFRSRCRTSSDTALPGRLRRAGMELDRFVLVLGGGTHLSRRSHLPDHRCHRDLFQPGVLDTCHAYHVPCNEIGD